MHNGTDRFLIRGKDIALILSILTLGGMVWGMYKKPVQWDEATAKVNDLAPRVDALEKVAAMNAERFTYISKELDAIDRKMGR